MKNLSKYLLLFLVLILASKEVHAQNDTSYFVRPLAFDMGVSDITHGLFVDPDSIVQYAVSFNSKITDTVKITVHFPGNIAPANKLLLEETRDSIIWVDSGSSYTINFPMKIYDYGASLLEAYVRPITPRHDLLDVGATGVEVLHEGSTSFSVVKTSDNVTVTDSGSYSSSPLASGLNTLSFHLSGKVNFFDPYQFGGAARGLYGAKVILMFRKKGQCSNCPCGNDFSSLSHPVVVGCIEGTHFSTIDINGNFSFDFSVTSSDTKWSDEYYDAQLFITNSNDAIRLIPHSENINSQTSAFKIKNTQCGDLSVFFAAQIGVASH